MALKDRTKWLLAEGLQDMLKTMEFEKIRVADLCRKCDVSRQVFYYHFHDIYDLAAWIYLNDNATLQGIEFDSYYEFLLHGFRLADQRRDFYSRILTDFPQNYVKKYIHRYDVENIVHLLKAQHGADYVDISMLLDIRCCSYGATNMIVNWLTGEYDISAEELAKCIDRNTPMFMKESLIRKRRYGGFENGTI